MSERLLYISKTCPHSSKMLVGLHKHGLLTHFKVIDVGTIPQEQIPPYIQTVPCLIYGNNMIKGDKLFEYMNMFAQETLGKQGPQQQQGPRQQGPGPQQQATQNQGQRTEQMQQQGPGQQQPGQQQPGPQDQGGDGDFEGWCPDGGCSIGFSMISESNDDCQNNLAKQDDSMFYLDNDESLTGSLNPSASGGSVQNGSTNDDFQKSAKRGEMDQAYEKMMENRRT